MIKKYPNRKWSSMRPDIIRMATRLDKKGAYDLSDRMEQLAQFDDIASYPPDIDPRSKISGSRKSGMVRLSLTGRELASLYALQAMGVPSDYQGQLTLDSPEDPQETSFLVDTLKGRSMLIEYASDLSDRIRDENEIRIQNYIDEWDQPQDLDIHNEEAINSIRPDDSDLIGPAEDFLMDCINHAGLRTELDLSENDHTFPWNTKQLRLIHDASMTTRNMTRLSQAGTGQTELDIDIESFANKVGDDLGNYDISDTIWSMWNAAKGQTAGDDQIATQIFKKNLLWLIKQPVFLDSFWIYHVGNEEYDYYNDIYKENNRMDESEIREQVFEEYARDEHILIDQACDELDQLIHQAERTGEREDYLAIMAKIDDFSSMSHHGGPAFEYADTTFSRLGEEEPNLFDIMNRKSGDRFLPWLIASGNFPEEYLPDLHQWYEERIEQEGSDAYRRDLEERNKDPRGAGSGINREVSRDDYYRHPYYSARDRWIAQHSPTFQTWTPYEYLDDDANVQSVGRSMLYQQNDYQSPRAAEMEKFVKMRGGHYTALEPDMFDRAEPRPRLRPIEASIVHGMNRTATRADKMGCHAIADEVDLVVMALTQGISSGGVIV